MGRRSLHLLLDEIDDGARSTTRETVPPELIVRASAPGGRQPGRGRA